MRDISATLVRVCGAGAVRVCAARVRHSSGSGGWSVVDLVVDRRSVGPVVYRSRRVGVGQGPVVLPFPVGGVNPQGLRGPAAGLHSFVALSQVRQG